MKPTDMLLLLGTYDTVWVSKSGVPNLNSFNGPQTDHKPSLFLLSSSFYISLPADKQTKFTLPKMHWLYIMYPSVCVCILHIHTGKRSKEQSSDSLKRIKVKTTLNIMKVRGEIFVQLQMCGGIHKAEE